MSKPAAPRIDPLTLKAREEFIELLLIEYEYWRACEDPRIQEIAIGAMGSVANVLGAVATDVTPEQYREQKQREPQGLVTYPELFYIQNVGFAGNCLKWWRPDGKGYTGDLREAWKVSKQQADKICRDRPKEDIAWPANVAEDVAQLHVTGSLKQALELAEHSESVESPKQK